jgi:hypothetical protein
VEMTTTGVEMTRTGVEMTADTTALARWRGLVARQQWRCC